MLENVFPYKIAGKVIEVNESFIKVKHPLLKIGDIVQIEDENSNKIIGEIVSIKNKEATVIPFGDTKGLDENSLVLKFGENECIKSGEEFLGRVVNALNQPIDEKGEINSHDMIYKNLSPILPLERETIKEVIPTGVKVIDGILTMGKGQRIGIFAGAGVGKSTLLSMIAKNIQSDINIINLIGERGREVFEFIHDILGEEGLKKSIVVVSTSDDHPLQKIKSFELAHFHAEYFRKQGKNVLLLIDSLTRYAMAKREIGLALGEPPTTKGYPPSVFVSIPRYVEKLGNFKNGGSITGIYTVLVEGDDPFSDPIAEHAVSILDGHIVLSRDLSSEGIYPAVDITVSVSRLMYKIVSSNHYQLAQKAVSVVSSFNKVKELVEMGLYKKGSSASTDEAIRLYPKIMNYIKQKPNEHYNFNETLELLKKALTG